MLEGFRPAIVILMAIFLGLAAFSGVEAYRTNPYVWHPFTTPPKSQVEYGETGFTLKPSPYLSSASVDIEYNVTGPSISAGSSVLLGAQVGFRQFPEGWSVIDITIVPDGAVFPSPNTPLPAILPILGFTGKATYPYAQVWSVKQNVTLESSGSFGATVVFNLGLSGSNNATLAYLAGTHFNFGPYFHNTTATIQVAPASMLQEQVYQNENASLTFFILFFASFEIAVTLAEHSKIPKPGGT